MVSRHRPHQNGMAALVVLVLGLFAGCAQPAHPPLPPPSATSVEASDYIIGPGDTLGVFVYQAPEFSVDLPVRPDGKFSLPLVADIEAAGRTPSQLARQIESRLRRYLVNPNVTVMVRSFVGPSARQVRVVGEAAQPRALPYREGMTVLDAMIDVGGITRFAAGNNATVVRRASEDAPAQTFSVRLSDLLRNGDVSQDAPLRPGDTIIIPQSWF
jgi:polysaccharide export outer membrane protein